MQGSIFFISDKTLQKKNKIHEVLHFGSDRFEISVLLGYCMHHWVMDARRLETT
jgi:hypothetical protein